VPSPTSMDRGRPGICGSFFLLTFFTVHHERQQKKEGGKDGEGGEKNLTRPPVKSVTVAPINRTVPGPFFFPNR